MVRVTFAGPELEGFDVGQPAASIRLLVPPPGTSELVMPRWERNIFLLADGTRAPIRTFTPLRADPTNGRVDIDVVVHGKGVASMWATRAQAGDEAAISGPGRGYDIDPHVRRYLLVGDETAVPAMNQLAEAIPVDVEVKAYVEITADEAAQPDRWPANAEVTWLVAAGGEPPGASLVSAVERAGVEPGTKLWVAGEAAAVQRIRRLLFEERGLSRSDAVVRGYWKHGRAGDD